MSTIQIYNKKKDKELYNEYSERILKIARKTLCFGEVSNEFIQHTSKFSNYLFVHSNNNTIRGFAYVSMNHSPKHLYIDLICNSKFHNMSRKSTKNAIQFSGKHIIQEIIKFGKKIKVKYVKLSAITNVILYYYKIGFRFPNSNNIDQTLLDDLRNSQLNNNDIEFQKHLKKIVSKYYSGFYDEKKQRIYEENKNISAMDDGIPMIYYFKTPSICKGKTIKNPNKCSKHKQCKIAIGEKRSFCRTLKNKTL